MSHASTDWLDEGSPPRPRALSRSTLMMVRRVLHAYREGWLPEKRLAQAARMAAEDARQGGLAAEQMLVALKREWAELEEVRRLSRPDARELLARLVTLSIRAYYQRAQRPGTPTPPSGHGGARTAA
jgi:hypothetical protein